jgi:hypothetical protein
MILVDMDDSSHDCAYTSQTEFLHPPGFLMRTKPFVVAALLFHASATFAAESMAPSDIQATFFNGQPFTAATLSGVKFKMTFTPDGKMTREPFAQSGSKSAGTWKLNTQGFCTRWGRAKVSCFTVVPIGENKWSVKRIATTIAVTVAVWSK